MNFRISCFLRFFCCLILLASSINSLENNYNSGEDESPNRASKNERVSSIKEQLKQLSVELRQSKEREDVLKIEVEKIDQALNELKSTVDGIKLRVNEKDAVNDLRLTQLSDEINNFKNGNEKLKIEVNAINKVLTKNGTMQKSGIPFIDFQKCKKSLEIEKDEPTFTWVITDMKKKMNQTEFSIESDIFPLKGYSMKAQAKLKLSNERLYCFLSFKDSNKSSEDVIDLKVFPWVTYVFKNQYELGHYDHIRVRNTFPRFNDTIKYDTNVYSNLLLAYGYYADDTVLMDVYVETPEQAEQRCSEDGTIAWAIHDVSKKRELEKAGHVLGQASPYFYSGPKGYRMVVGIELNYYDYHQNRSVLRLESGPISGPYDDGLNTSFTMTTTATFFHPTDATKNIVRSKVIKIPPKINEPISRPMIYLTKEELESVLVEDTLYYKVTNKFI